MPNKYFLKNNFFSKKVLTYEHKTGIITFVGEIRTKKAERNAGVAELADAQASGACGRKIVWVQVPSPASFFIQNILFTYSGHICPNYSLIIYI